MRFASPHRRLRRAVRIGGLLVFFAVVALRLAPEAHAQLTGTKSCTSTEGGSTGTVGETITCTLTITPSDPMNDLPGGATIVVSPGTNYTFTGTPTCAASSGDTCTATLTSGTITVVCNPASPPALQCESLVVTEFLTITALTPNTISQTVVRTTPTATPPFTVIDTLFRIVPPGLTFFVSTTGSDTNNCETRATACATINRAHHVARDGDAILVLAGTYTITQTIRITKLVRIEPDGPVKVILKANPGVTIFEVVAQGGPDQGGATRHVSIRNFTMGGNFRTGSTEPAIRLLNDNYTEISGNIIGAEDLPVNNGIVLANSDHPNISNNTIQGSSQFVFNPVLTVGKTVTGFGVISVECFGTSLPGVSDSVTIANNLFTNLWVAGIWLCSDGAGEHEIVGNVFRNNWRGIALKDVTDTHVGSNTLIDDRNDGIIVYGASLHNRIEGNRIESHVAADAAGIRIGWVADPLAPLDNLVENNQLVRVTVGVHVFGARTTVIRGNQIKVSGARTAVLLTPSTTLGDPGTQPYDTEVVGNTIVFTGPCTPVIGCGLRLLGVVTPVLAVDNDWGLRRVRDVEAVIWHNYDDPAVGLVTFIPYRNMVVEAGTPPAQAAPPPPPPPPTSPPSNGGMPPTAAATVTAGGGNVSAGGAPVTSLPLSAGCSTVNWPGASGVSVADVVLGIMPAAAQQSATIWRRDNGEWRGYGPARDQPADVFTIRRNDPLLVCVSRAATWLIPTQVGGP